MNEQKSLLLPVLLAVLASAIAFGGLGYYLGKAQYITMPTYKDSATKTSPAIDGTNGLKTYANTKYGFTLSYSTKLVNYPESAGLVPEPADNSSNDFYFSVEDTNPKYKAYEHTLRFHAVEDDSTKKFEQEKFIAMTKEPNTQKVSTEIGGQEATKIIKADGSEEIYVKRSGYDLYISLPFRGPDRSPQIDEIFTPVLETLVFTR